MAMNHLGKSAKLRSAGLPQNSEQQQKKQTPKWLIWALRLLSLCGGCGAIPSATSPSCRGTCQLLQAPSCHGMPCPRACPASPGRSRVSGATWAADAPEGEQNKDDIVPHASSGNSHHFFSPQLVYGRQLPSFILTLKKKIIIQQGGVRESAQQWHGHKCMQGMRRREAAQLPRAHKSHQLDNDLSCTAYC